jgi:RNA polymerase sigma-70 factor (ECF subfamily)
MTWIITIGRRKAIDQMRRHRRETVTDQVPEQATDPGKSPQALAIAGNHAEQLQLCIDELSTSQRRSVELAFFRGATHGEVSDALSKPVGTVKSWIRRGLQALKRCLER